MTKPVLLLDLDGPLADFDAAFRQLCYERGWPLEGPPQRKMVDNLVHEDHRRRSREVIERTHWFRELPLVEGARDGVTELHEHFDVWVCTKPMESNPWCASDKMAWIKEFFPELHEKMVITPRKGLVHGAVLLDDAPALACVREAVWEPVVFVAPFNGLGSRWEDYWHWTWGDPVEVLLSAADGS